MPLKTIVKVSHISNLSDARYCAGMGVEMLGFQVIPGNENYMPAERFQDIRGWISGPRIIAEIYGVTTSDEIMSVIETYAPDYLELSFQEFRAFRPDLTLPCIVAVTEEELASLEEDEKIAYLLVSRATPCGKIVNVGLPTLVNIETIEHLKKKLADDCFHGFVLEGPQELRPGVTNYEQLGSILEALEED